MILAGGLSTRMGFPKALMRLGERTWMETIVDAYEQAGLSDVLAVTHRAVADHPDFPGRSGNVLVLDEPTPGPLCTLWKALDVIPSAWNCFFVHPVDHPLVRSETLSSMAQAYSHLDYQIIQPVHDNRGGHPILIDRILESEIRAASPDQGLRQVVRKDPSRVHRLSFDDKGILKGMNRPEDLPY